MPLKVRVVCGDLTTFQGDAIVNAANPSLLGGGGVDGAIHRAAGPELRDFCEGLSPMDPEEPDIRCLPSEVRMTPGFNLPPRYVLHTVGPIFNLKRDAEEARELLARCFTNIGDMALAMKLHKIAIPAISTGIYGCPHEICAEVAHQWCQSLADSNLQVTFYLMPDGYDIWLAEFGREAAF